MHHADDVPTGEHEANPPTVHEQSGRQAMKALTLHQPWASLIALGVKHMETRSWQTPYRGRLAIHAGRGTPLRRGETLQLGEWHVQRDGLGLLLEGPDGRPQRLPTGVIVAIATVRGIRSTDDPTHQPNHLERAAGDHSPGRYAWLLDEISPITGELPKATGHLGLWDWPAPAALDQPTPVASALHGVAS